MSYWAKTYGGGEAYGVAVDNSNGDIIVVGKEGVSKSNAFIVRLDKNGNIKWFKTYGGSKNDVFKDVKIASNGDIIVVGYYGATDWKGNGATAWVLRLDRSGNVKWQKTYGGNRNDWANAVALADNGDIIVVGHTESFGVGYHNAWVLRLDENGDIKWQKTYGGSGYDEANAVVVTPNRDIIITGYTSSFKLDTVWSHVWILCLDSDGDVKWQKIYEGRSQEEAYAIVLANNSRDIIVAGWTNSTGTGGSVACVLRLGADGNIKWQKAYGGSKWEEARAVALADNGDIIVVGYTNSFGAGSHDAWVLRLDENGDIKWQKTYGGSGYDEANAVALADNGDIIVVGNWNSGNIWILRLPPNGSSPDCAICSDSMAQVENTNAKVRTANCEVLSGIKKYQVEVDEGFLFKKKRKEWRTERVSLAVKNSNAQVKTLQIKPETQYYFDPEPVLKNLKAALAVSIPSLTETLPSIAKLSLSNTFVDSLKATLDLSENDFLDLETATLEFPTLTRGKTVSKSITVTPKYAGKFDFKVKIKAIADGLEVETEKVIPVEVKEKTITSTSPKITPRTPALTPSQFTPSPTTTGTLPPELAELYTEVEYIGKGGFARVFKARRKRDGEIVALKVPISLDPATGKSFLREIENWTKLKHPNIVRVYDYNILPIPFFEMEYCDDSLENLLKRKGVLTPIEAAGIIFNVAEGLEYAHSKGIIHRDLKPSNILFKAGIPKISDWGLSKVMKESRSFTLAGFTPYYAAPEQISKSRFGSTDQRTDIWQLGVILYQLVTGKLPFEGEDLVEVGFAVINKTPKRPSKINPEAKPLDDIIMHCLAKRKEERFESVAELQGELALLLGVDYHREFKRAKKSGDLSRSAYYAGDLLLINLKIGDIGAAYRYAGDLVNYARGETRDELLALKEQLKLRLEEGLDVPPELMEKAEIIVHKIKLGFREV